MNLTTRAVLLRRRAYGLVAAMAALFLFVPNVGGQSITSIPLGPMPWIDSGFHNTDLTWSGSVTTQGDAVMNAPNARSTYNVNGAGIKIGIISDSFNNLGGMSAGISSGDLSGPGNPNGFTTG